ncbi:U6 snRNA-associated Sm-like protein LSm1 isoform X1 [Myotis daubentonii]|uniref:U6 snRNA-associated Sm-like protein LSm1 isoform X1 n=1 Tax=Myotis daubentonii TaxID=98922 RepID=UPI002873B84C|nr:U6 snRNA-associated Sm-like protein LSm1 isoform X1 [Myotis daubentonii]
MDLCDSGDRGIRKTRSSTVFLRKENSFSLRLCHLDSFSPLFKAEERVSQDRTMAPPLPEDSTWYRKWVGIIWRSFRRAPAAESRGRSAGPGLGPRPRPAEAATTVGGRRCWTRGPFAALRCSLISAQHELYARHRQPHRGHRQSFFLFPEKHLVLLRDGRTLIGFLRSIDQFDKKVEIEDVSDSNHKVSGGTRTEGLRIQNLCFLRSSSQHPHYHRNQPKGRCCCPVLTCSEPGPRQVQGPSPQLSGTCRGINLPPQPTISWLNNQSSPGQPALNPQIPSPYCWPFVLLGYPHSILYLKPG